MSATIAGAFGAPFLQRHEPRTFGDLVFANSNAQQRLGMYAVSQLHHSIILYGPYGTAKSTTAKVIVQDRRALCSVTGPYIHHYSGAYLAKNFGTLLGSLNLMLVSEPDPHPYIIIDEADQLPVALQQNLRHLLSTMPDLRLIMTTNAVAKIDGGIQSRCDCVAMLPATPADWLWRARAILATEGVNVAQDALLRLLATAGDVRDMLRDLEALVVLRRLALPNAPLVQAPQSPAPASVHAAPALTVVPGNAQVIGGSLNSGNAPGLTVLPQPQPSAPGKTTP